MIGGVEEVRFVMTVCLDFVWSQCEQ